MLDYGSIARLPASIVLSRNGFEIRAARKLIGSLRVTSGRLRIADSGWSNQAPPLPVEVPIGTHPVHAYQWDHSRGPVNACVVVWFCEPRRPTARRLTIETDVRPDVTDGLIVDSGEIDVRSRNRLTIPSGLGDGCYPVVANFNADGAIQSVVVDFMLWKVERYTEGQQVDAFGVPTGADETCTPSEAAAIREKYRRGRRARVARDIAEGARFGSGPPCPSCGRPLRTAKAKQCFLCGYNGHPGQDGDRP